MQISYLSLGRIYFSYLSRFPHTIIPTGNIYYGPEAFPVSQSSKLLEEIAESYESKKSLQFVFINIFTSIFILFEEKLIYKTPKKIKSKNKEHRKKHKTNKIERKIRKR